MICKWCGEAVDPAKGVCGNCGRELPPISDCGGFYQVMPSARLIQAQQQNNQGQSYPVKRPDDQTQKDLQNRPNPIPDPNKKVKRNKSGGALPVLLMVFMGLSLLALILSILFFALTSARLTKIEDQLAVPPSVSDPSPDGAREEPDTESPSISELEPETENATTPPSDSSAQPSGQSQSPDDSDPGSKDPLDDLRELFGKSDIVLTCSAIDAMKTMNYGQIISFTVFGEMRDGSPFSDYSGLVQDNLYGKWSFDETNKALTLNLYEANETEPFAQLSMHMEPSKFGGQSIKVSAEIDVSDNQQLLAEYKNDASSTYKWAILNDNDKEQLSINDLSDILQDNLLANQYSSRVEDSSQRLNVYCQRIPDENSSFTIIVGDIPMEWILKMSDSQR